MAQPGGIIYAVCRLVLRATPLPGSASPLLLPFLNVFLGLTPGPLRSCVSWRCLKHALLLAAMRLVLYFCDRLGTVG